MPSALSRWEPPFQMRPEDLHVDPDIRRASTLPPEFYHDPEWFARTRDRVLSSGWHLIADHDRVRVPGQCFPFTLLEGVLDEPLLLTRDQDDRLRCLSNVCTHRGMLVCEGERNQTSLRCRYHGRRFGLDGRFLSMPEFAGVENFPSASDDLAPVPVATWNRFVFVSLAPAMPFETLAAEVQARLGWLPFDRMALDPSRSRDYLVRAHWALYLDNYLEGFHVPYVHAGLTDTIDFARYRTETFASGSVQVAPAAAGEPALEPPAGSPDHGQRIAAYYFWLFPTTMFNVYPWGISVNVVKPLAPDRTRVAFLAYVWDEALLERGAGASLDRVEREDESVVEAVQAGVRGRFYRRGRYSPAQEAGVHHFHRLLAEHLRTSSPGR